MFLLFLVSVAEAETRKVTLERAFHDFEHSFERSFCVP